MKWRFEVLGTAAVLIGGAAIVVASGAGDQPETLRPRILTDRAKEATELLAVFVVSADCGATQDLALRSAMPRIWAEMRRTGMALKMRVITIGVAVDSDVEVGIRLLRKFGPFDEIIAGGGWLNSGAIQYLSGQVRGPLAVPQLVLMERDVRPAVGDYAVGELRLVTRRVGADRITAFASAAVRGGERVLGPY